jgi:hypothetical protein
MAQAHIRQQGEGSWEIKFELSEREDERGSK